MDISVIYEITISIVAIFLYFAHKHEKDVRKRTYSELIEVRKMCRELQSDRDNFKKSASLTLAITNDDLHNCKLAIQSLKDINYKTSLRIGSLNQELRIKESVIENQKGIIKHLLLSRNGIKGRYTQLLSIEREKLNYANKTVAAYMKIINIIAISAAMIEDLKEVDEYPEIPAGAPINVGDKFTYMGIKSEAVTPWIGNCLTECPFRKLNVCCTINCLGVSLIPAK